MPEQDIYFDFSGGEEVNGMGAVHIVDYFEKNGIPPALVVDEGGAVVKDVLTGVSAPRCQCALRPDRPCGEGAPGREVPGEVVRRPRFRAEASYAGGVLVRNLLQGGASSVQGPSDETGGLYPDGEERCFQRNSA